MNNDKDFFFMIFFFIFLSLSMINISFAFNVCGVDFGLGGDFKTASVSSVFYIDGDGDILINGKKSSSANLDNLKWFDSSSFLYFGTINSKFSVVNENLGTISNKGFLFSDSFNNPLATLGVNGEIESKGAVLYDERGRGTDTFNLNTCSNDGMYCANFNRASVEGLYLSTLSSYVQGYKEDRDYYCDITGSKSGRCEYDVKSSVQCTTFGNGVHQGEFFYLDCNGNYIQKHEPGCNSGTCNGDFVTDSTYFNCGSTIICTNTHVEYYNCNPVETCTGVYASAVGYPSACYDAVAVGNYCSTNTCTIGGSCACTTSYSSCPVDVCDTDRIKGCDPNDSNGDGNLCYDYYTYY